MAGELTQWVIYDHPADYPQYVVVRQWVIKAGQIEIGPAMLCDSLEQAREDVPLGLYCLDRHPDDDPTIVEVWL